MNTQSQERTIEDQILAIALTGTERPSGMVDWMHYGFALRNGAVWERVAGGDGWQSLEAVVDDLSGDARARVVPLVEARAWTVGLHGLRKLPEALWSRLSPLARGRFLAGMSRHLRRDNANTNKLEDVISGAPQPLPFDLSAWILERLPQSILDAASAAEIGANAIRTRLHDLLVAVITRSDLPSDRVPRVSGYSYQTDFEAHLSRLSTRLLDVLLEAAVCSCNLKAMRLLLERSATPDICCWNLERNYNEYSCALSFAVEAEHHGFAEAKRGYEMADLLLEFGADPQGLECEGKNRALVLALSARNWGLADRLLALGARFEGGKNYKPDECSLEGRRFIPGGNPLIGYRKEELAWVKRSIAPLVPLAEIWQAPLFHRANGQGGYAITFLDAVLADEHLPMLKKYEAMGLPTTLTSLQFLNIVNGGCYNALCYLLRDNPNLPRVMDRILRRMPDFGTARRQLYLCQPERDGSNVVTDFNPHGQEPLQLPDGSRVYVCLDAIAPPDHTHGPITEGCLWMEKVTAEYRRRPDRIATRNVRRIWRMELVPTNIYQMKGMLPLVKEVNGQFIWLGDILDSLSFFQTVPEDWRPIIHGWLDGYASQHICQIFAERINAQRAANMQAPVPVLSADELKAYPREFWPFLRRVKDGSIGMSEESCRLKPDMLDIYSIWERQNKPDQDFQPDPRLLDWPMWSKVPVELRPYFYFDELFGKPSITFNSRNEYEKEMIHKAVRWNNEWMMQSMKDAGVF